MNVLPVIERELRAESRRPFTFWLRVLGAGALTLVCAATLFSVFAADGASPGLRLPGGGLGIVLFGNLNACLFVAIWILVPLLTVDCISRERREGTLGLLFLTPLSAQAIVAGKSFVHGLRALTLLVSTLPLLVLPVVFGGVTFEDGVMAALLDFGALCLALSAGLLASAWTKDRLKGVALAQLLGCFFAITFMIAQQQNLERAVTNAQAGPAFAAKTPNAWRGGRSGNPWSISWSNDGLLSTLGRIFELSTGLPELRRYDPWGNYRPFYSPWAEVRTKYPSAQAGWLKGTAVLILGTFLLFLGAVLGAALKVKKSWRDAPKSERHQRIEARLNQTVVGRSLLRRKLRRALERNPIGWLHQYSANARLTKWGWCAFIVIVELIFASHWQDAWEAQFWVALLLLGGLAFSATGSFRRERETGALELLLVTPLQAGQVIRGRLQGILTQYLPAVATLLVAWAALLQPVWWRELLHPASWERSFIEWVFFVAFVGISFVTVPVIGLSFSLRRLNHVGSWLFACGIGLFIPAILIGLSDLLPFTEFGRTEIQQNLLQLLPATLWQILAAAVAGMSTHSHLVERRFVLQ